MLKCLYAQGANASNIFVYPYLRDGSFFDN